MLVNGSLIRILDLNDYVNTRDGQIGGHPSDNIPVALAAGELQGSSGRDVLAAIVVGYEVYGRLKEMMDRESIWDGVTVSGFAAPAMAGRLMGLDKVQLANALALAGARAVTPLVVRQGDISAAKSVSNALVAQSAMQAAMLAQHGLTGPLDLFENPAGLKSVFPGIEGPDSIAGPIPADSYIMNSHMKAYPCLATGQAIVAAGLNLHRQVNGDVDRLTKITVAIADKPTLVRQMRDPGRVDPQSREAADHSFNFLAAVALLDGDFALAQFDNDRWHDAKVRAVMARLEMTTDASLNAKAPSGFPSLDPGPRPRRQGIRGGSHRAAGRVPQWHRRGRGGEEVQRQQRQESHARRARPHHRRGHRARPQRILGRGYRGARGRAAEVTRRRGPGCARFKASIPECLIRCVRIRFSPRKVRPRGDILQVRGSAAQVCAAGARGLTRHFHNLTLSSAAAPRGLEVAGRGGRNQNPSTVFEPLCWHIATEGRAGNKTPRILQTPRRPANAGMSRGSGPCSTPRKTSAISLPARFGLSLAGAFAAAIPAASVPNYDGLWSVVIMTQRGTCDRAYRYPVRIARGTLVNAGDSARRCFRPGRRQRQLVVQVSALGKTATAQGSSTASMARAPGAAGIAPASGRPRSVAPELTTHPVSIFTRPLTRPGGRSNCM